MVDLIGSNLLRRIQPSCRPCASSYYDPTRLELPEISVVNIQPIHTNLRRILFARHHFVKHEIILRRVISPAICLRKWQVGQPLLGKALLLDFIACDRTKTVVAEHLHVDSVAHFVLDVG